MHTKQYKYIITLGREGSFSKAADVLGISQPSLSQYIKKIEREIGLPLFERTNGNIRVTDAGRACIEAGQKILGIERQLELSFTDLSACKTGSLIIGAAPYRAAAMMPLIAKRFQLAHPGIYLIVREGTTTELLENLEHGVYDLALTLLPVDKRLFKYEKIEEEELLLAVPGDCPLFPAMNDSGSRYPAVDASVLSGQKLVMLTDTQIMQQLLNDLIVDRELRVRPAAVVKSLEAQIEMVKAGVGMALVPSGIERFCEKDSVRFYSFAESLPKREIAIVWRRNSPLSAVAEELKQVIHLIPW
jgi:DNA-binding transcriptional LysR family regulator